MFVCVFEAPYWCAQGQVMYATSSCMSGLGLTVATSTLINKANSYSNAGSIDPLSNLKNHRVYIYSGSKDTTVASSNYSRNYSVKLTRKFYHSLWKKNHIQTIQKYQKRSILVLLLEFEIKFIDLISMIHFERYLLSNAEFSMFKQQHLSILNKLNNFLSFLAD